MDLQLRALDSVITRKLDNLIDPFVRWNIKLVLLAQLATILISPSISFHSELQCKNEKQKKELTLEQTFLQANAAL